MKQLLLILMLSTLSFSAFGFDASFVKKIVRKTKINKVALENALDFYSRNYKKLKNKKTITIFDISKHSGKKRLYVIDVDTEKAYMLHVTHGENSDRNDDGYATHFSNTSGSHQSSLGFMRTAETYTGRNGHSMRMDGLERRNSRVRPRAIVVHGASYVSDKYRKMGRSWGCPAVDHKYNKWLISKIKGGSLFYIFHPKYDS